MSDLRQRAADFLTVHGCRDRWMDGDNPVCSVHGFYWPDGQQMCNGVEDAEAYGILAELAEQPAATGTDATLTLASAARLLNLLADGRAYYADGYPPGDGLDYLNAQIGTLRSAARIFTDQTDTSVSLFMPTHMVPAWEALLAELDLAVPDRQALSDVALLYRQAGHPSAG